MRYRRNRKMNYLDITDELRCFDLGAEAAFYGEPKYKYNTRALRRAYNRGYKYGLRARKTRLKGE